MNNPIRRLSVIVGILFTMLLFAGSWIQFASAGDLRDRPGNRRALLASYGRERGSIIVEGTPIARSEAVDGDLKFLRTYPRGKLFSHVTGYYSFVYGAGGGLEYAANEDLSGSSDAVGSSRVDLQACKLEYSIVSPK